MDHGLEVNKPVIQCKTKDDMLLTMPLNLNPCVLIIQTKSLPSKWWIHSVGIGYEVLVLTIISENWPSAEMYSDVLDAAISKDLNLGRKVGPLIPLDNVITDRPVCEQKTWRKYMFGYIYYNY